MRPAELATDEADSMAVVRHAISVLPERYDYLVLLQPTSPMRLAEDIDRRDRALRHGRGAGLRQRLRARQESVLDVKDGADDVLQPLFPPDQIPDRRQDAPAVLALNGAVYVARTGHLASGGTFLAAGHGRIRHAEGALVRHRHRA